MENQQIGNELAINANIYSTECLQMNDIRCIYRFYDNHIPRIIPAGFGRQLNDLMALQFDIVLT